VLAGAITAYGGGEMLLPSLALGAGVAAVVMVLASLWSFYSGSEVILKLSGARPIEKSADPQLFNVVEELAIAAGIPMPRVFIIPDDAINAFATGRDPEHGAVAITIGLRQLLNRDELAGVMAHELSHIRYYDIRFAMLMATMVGLIVFACDAFWRVMWYGNWHGTGRRSIKGGDKGAGVVILVVMVLAILLAILAPTLAMLIRLAVSRQREFLADAGAVELTRYPAGLIGALEKLGASKVPLRAANRATAHLYIVNPLRNALRGKGHELSSALRTHPPLHERIARLRALME
jgi:heat shock protein HtpX